MEAEALVGEARLRALLERIGDEELLGLVRRLPEAEREVVLMQRTLELDVEELAAVLDRTSAEVRNLQGRVAASLHQCLAALDRAPTGERRTEHWTRRLNQAGVLRERRFALMR